MEPFDGDLVHFVGDRVIPVSSQAVDAGPDQEMSSDLLCCAEKLVDVTLAITDMDASSRMIQESRRLLEIFQPPDAFLFLDGNPGRIDLLFKRCRALEFLASPELNGRQPQRHPVDCNREARMHQDAANRVRSEATRLILSTVYALGDADRF